jgi:hypothetical protein
MTRHEVDMESIPASQPEIVPYSDSEPRRSRPVQIPVRWIRRQHDLDCQAAEVELDGMFLCTSEKVRPGALLELEVSPPDEPPIRMFVTAVFVGRAAAGPGIGVEIRVIDGASRMMWERYCQALFAASDPAEAWPAALP